ncbi:MAG: NAD(P)H-dependent oxidoreductase subunit E [Nitrospirota bacterium]
MMDINFDAQYKMLGNALTADQKRRGLIIHSLQEIQKEHNYLPEDVLKELSRSLKVPISVIYSTASFYKHFYFEPRGKNIVSVCTGTACHVRGATKVLNTLEEEFGIKRGETTKDLSLTIETVGCVGCCGLAPVVVVNNEVVGDVEIKKTEEIIEMVK